MVVFVKLLESDAKAVSHFLLGDGAFDTDGPEPAGDAEVTWIRALLFHHGSLDLGGDVHENAILIEEPTSSSRISSPVRSHPPRGFPSKS